MNYKLPMGLLLALTLGSHVVVAQAQSAAPASPTRAQVRMDTKEFLQTHRWDQALGNWVLKAGVEPPVGVISRAEVKLKRDEFLRLNRWNRQTGGWVPRTAPPKAMSELTRQQVRDDTQAFMRTHEWSEETGTWVANPPRKAN